MDKRKRRLLCMLEGSGRKSRWISGVPPLSFKALVAGELENYRIYGNTVGGESVGDKTENLFDGEWENKYIATNGGTGYSTNRLLSSYINVIPGQTYSVKANVFIRAVHSYNGTAHTQALIDETSGLDGATFTVPSDSDSILISLKRASDWVLTPDDVEWCMLNAGSASIPYEPYGYRVPVSVTNGTDTEITNLYLPEQIKMVGSEAEYIDYGEQKLHRVRKNLLQNTATSQENNGVTFTVNSDGSVTCNGTASATASILLQAQITLNSGSYILTGCPQGGGVNTNYKLYIIDPIASVAVAIDTGSGASLTLRQNMQARIVIYTGQVLNNLTFYPMIRKADIEDDTYEPYIEDTDLDVTLPALPVAAGTNVLTVGTAVQPSEIEVKGKIKAL